MNEFFKLKELDKFGMLNFIEQAPNYLRSTLNLIKTEWDSSLEKYFEGLEVNNIIISGLGGSAISGDIIVDWIWGKSPFLIMVNRDYRLPKFAGEKTLVIVVSYSGDTFETLAQFYEAYKRKCVLFAVSSGGKLKKASEKLNIPFLKVKEGLPPRAALPCLLPSVAYIISKFNSFIPISELELAADRMDEMKKDIDFSRELEENLAKKMALNIFGRFPTIYAFINMSSVARRIKDQINENSKTPAKFEFLPEACHNEIEGIHYSEKEKFCFLFVEGQEEIEKTAINEFKKVLKENDLTNIFDIPVKGERKIEKILTSIYFGDYLSFYLSLLSKVDPTITRNIQEYKKGINSEASKLINYFEKFIL
ncbi:MAG: bifunctional phosphoglucose/phosphomannose isomerase [Candidatus Bathyarchaeia archaeon]|nr:bifunctional phosphoglucose/phosphomannose isomerase [Candidatus Bathyarchaeota archaeon]